MRIDDENKVVWCNESEMSWYTSFNLSVGNDTFLNLRRINTLSTEKEVLLPSYMTITDRIEVIRAISDNYTFKLEQQKYYWRKKKEYLFDFEKHLDWFLNYDAIDEKIITSVNKAEAYDFKTKFTETEVINLLGKDDFDKFEKVECE